MIGVLLKLREMLATADPRINELIADVLMLVLKIDKINDHGTDEKIPGSAKLLADEMIGVLLLNVE